MIGPELKKLDWKAMFLMTMLYWLSIKLQGVVIKRNKTEY